MTIQSNDYTKAVKEALVETSSKACDVIQEKIDQLRSDRNLGLTMVRPEQILTLLEDLNKIVKKSL